MKERKQISTGQTRKFAPWAALALAVYMVLSLYSRSAPPPARPAKGDLPLESGKSTSTPKPASGGKDGNQSKKQVEIIVELLNLRATPDRKAGNVIASLRKGTVLDVISNQDGWLRVVLPDGRGGYIFYDEKYVRLK